MIPQRLPSAVFLCAGERKMSAYCEKVLDKRFSIVYNYFNMINL